MNVQHHSFTPARPIYFPKSDVLTATVPVTATLCLGHGGFVDFDAEVTVYRDAGEVVICETFYRTFAGKLVKVCPPVGSYAVSPPEFVHWSIIDACADPKVQKQMEDAMDDAEEGRDQ